MRIPARTCQAKCVCVCVGWGGLKRDRVALHLLNQSGAVFTATPTFSQIPPLTPFNPPSLNSTAPHSSQEEPRMGASQVCVRACERVHPAGMED